MQIIAKTLILSITLFTLVLTVPTNFTWSSVNSTNFVPPVHNQNNPSPCFSSWALTAADVFNSRMKIHRKAASPQFQISAQVLLSCDEIDYGCMGGEPLSAFRWIKKNNITDSSCQNYIAKGYTNGYGCSSQIKCQNCLSGTCKSSQHSKIFAVNDYGTVGGQPQMQQQIMNYGPIACGINGSALYTYTSGVLKGGNVQDNRVTHFVVIYGWGEDTAHGKYWLGKSSWGSAWGVDGHFMIQRGVNAYGVQGSCAWASPIDTWTNDTRNQTVPNNVASFQKVTKSLKIQQQQQFLQPQSLGYTIPPYLTSIRSSVTPHSCSSSWAFAIVQMISDRLSRATKGKNITRLSVQALINCGVGKCTKGGNPIDALLFIQKYGLPDESCQNYIGEDPAKQSCSGVLNCGYCTGSVFQYKCYEFKSYKRWKISNYTFLAGDDSMKTHLGDGPIVCGIYASDQFKNYRTGIISEITVNPKVDHYVEIVGYGTQNGVNYWLGRNFWGTAWGESSFFRIVMDSTKNLGINTKCYASKGLV